MRLSFQEVNPGLRRLRLTPAILLGVMLLLAVLPSVLQAKEETVLVLTTSDTRSELAPCG
jgi:hypothetical protein